MALKWITYCFNTEVININENWYLHVIATHPNDCFATRDITVEGSNLAVIEDVSVVGLAPDNSVTITVSGNGNYEYTLDNGLYQNSTVFTNVSAGEHSVFIRDINGCGVTENTILVLGFPTYFTPNGDGFS